MSTLALPRPDGQHTPAPDSVPADCRPTTLAERIDHEALSYRARDDEVGAFLADHLDRLARLVRWTGADTPAAHEDRMEAWDDEIRARFYDRGYEDGLEAARREYALRHGIPLD